MTNSIADGRAEAAWSGEKGRKAFHGRRRCIFEWLQMQPEIERGNFPIFLDRNQFKNLD